MFNVHGARLTNLIIKNMRLLFLIQASQLKPFDISFKLVLRRRLRLNELHCEMLRKIETINAVLIYLSRFIHDIPICLMKLNKKTFFEVVKSGVFDLNGPRKNLKETPRSI